MKGAHKRRPALIRLGSVGRSASTRNKYAKSGSYVSFIIKTCGSGVVREGREDRTKRTSAALPPNRYGEANSFVRSACPVTNHDTIPFFLSLYPESNRSTRIERFVDPLTESFSTYIVQRIEKERTQEERRTIVHDQTNINRIKWY